MISRRFFTAFLITLPLAACQTSQDRNPPIPVEQQSDNWYIGVIPDRPFDIPAVNWRHIAPEFHRQTVSFDGRERPGTIVIDTRARHLYYIQSPGVAIRYGIGVGKEGFAFRGAARVGRKAVWPDWSPTVNMVRINPSLPRHLPGGLDNPLGARALYLYQGNRDTLFRIHGTNEPWSIGEAVSSGCIRMMNEDVLDLYGRANVNTPVVVR